MAAVSGVPNVAGQEMAIHRLLAIKMEFLSA